MKCKIVWKHNELIILRELYTDNYFIVEEKDIAPCVEEKTDTTKKKFSYDWIDMAFAWLAGIIIWGVFIYFLMKQLWQ